MPRTLEKVLCINNVNRFCSECFLACGVKTVYNLINENIQ